MGVDPDTRALLDGIAGAVRAEVLVEQIGELDLLILVTDGIEVGQIVGGGGECGGIGVQSGKRDREIRHMGSLERNGCWAWGGR